MVKDYTSESERRRIGRKDTKRYAERKAAGLCVKCGDDRGDDGTKTLCRPCADRRAGRERRSNAERWAKRDAERKATGSCVDCGSPRGDDGTNALCRPCADHEAALHALRRESRKTAGLCANCGSPRGDDGTTALCRPCADRGATRQAERHAARKESGTCISCDVGVAGVSRYCKEHYLAALQVRYDFPPDLIKPLWAKLEAQGFRCHYTGVELVPGRNLSVDHRLPRSRGGGDELGNLVWTTVSVNSWKSARTEREFWRALVGG